MPDLLLERDGVETLANRLDPAQQFDAMLSLRLALHGRAHGKDADAVLTENAQECRVGKLAAHDRANSFGLKPLLKRAPQHGVLGRQQKRSAIERMRKAAPVSCHKLLRADKGDAAFAQQVTEGVDLDDRA